MQFSVCNCILNSYKTGLGVQQYIDLICTPLGLLLRFYLAHSQAQERLSENFVFFQTSLFKPVRKVKDETLVELLRIKRMHLL